MRVHGHNSTIANPPTIKRSEYKDSAAWVPLIKPGHTAQVSRSDLETIIWKSQQGTDSLILRRYVFIRNFT